MTEGKAKIGQKQVQSMDGALAREWRHGQMRQMANQRQSRRRNEVKEKSTRRNSRSSGLRPMIQVYIGNLLLVDLASTRTTWLQ